MKFTLPTILVVGPGSMGMAIIEGMIKSGAVNPAQIKVQHPNIKEEKRAYLEGIGVNVVNVPRDYEIVLLAVKPQKMANIKKEISVFNDDKTLFVSVAAGVSLASLKKYFGKNIIRAMPNITVKYAKGVTALYNSDVDQDQKDLANWFFGSIGQVIWTQEEEEFDQIMAVAGCGPAFIFNAVESLIKAGVSIGLKKEIAQKLVTQTFVGAGEFANMENKTMGELMLQVASKGGATEAGLKKMQSTINTAMKNAVKASLERYSED